MFNEFRFIQFYALLHTHQTAFIRWYIAANDASLFLLECNSPARKAVRLDVTWCLTFRSINCLCDLVLFSKTRLNKFRLLLRLMISLSCIWDLWMIFAFLSGIILGKYWKKRKRFLNVSVWLQFYSYWNSRLQKIGYMYG